MRSRTTAGIALSIALGIAIGAVAPTPGSAQQAGHQPGHQPGHPHGQTGHTGHTGHGARPATKPSGPTTSTRATPQERGGTARSRSDSAAARHGEHGTGPSPRDAARGARRAGAAASPEAAHARHDEPAAKQSLPAAAPATAPAATRASGGEATLHAPVTSAATATPEAATPEAATPEAAPGVEPREEPQTGRRLDALASHDMWMRPIGGGWHVMGMAQVFPTLTAGSTRQERSLLRTAGVYATQPAIMANVASPSARLVLRTTLNFEELTQENGELTFGGWGEGFIDSRHPHTLLHEAMLTANFWDVGGGALSISAGKGFAPYGTDDPMGRPAVKFPTNHHLSQVLERFTANVAYLKGGWGFEAGLFGGAEPKDAYDFSNIESFGDSWSARLSKRFGGGFGPFAPWEVGTSYARVKEDHHGEADVTELFNANVRHAQAHAFGTLYAMAEWSRSKPEAGRGHYAILGEALAGVGAGARHQPYVRVEYATRPEYERKGAPGTPEFYRYDHDAHEIGATRWLIGTIGYGYDSSALPASVRPYVELQRNSVRSARGGVDPRALYGSREFWSVSAGARIFLGGGPMRMGSYGALDPMTAPMRPSAGGSQGGHHGHGGH